MKPALFTVFMLLSTAICWSQPSLIIGQKQGLMFTDIAPDTWYSCSWPSGMRTCWRDYDYDVNHDGAIDFSLLHSNVECMYTSVRLWRLSPSSNVEFVVDSLGITPFKDGDTIGPGTNRSLDLSFTLLGTDSNYNSIYDTVPFLRNTWWADSAHMDWQSGIITHTAVGTLCPQGFDSWDINHPDTNYFAFRIIGDADTSYGWFKIILANPFNVGGESFAVTGDTGSYIINATEWVESHQEIHPYPNPASDKLFIETPFEECALEILSIEGVSRTSVSSLRRNESVDVTHLPPGFYLINIKSEGISVIKRFIKE